MASSIEDAETYQQSTTIIPSFIDSNNDLVPLTSPTCDPIAVRRSATLGSITRGTNRLGTVFLIINAALGAGLLNFPSAFNQAGGIEVALAVQALLIVFVVFSLIFLAKCSDFNGSPTIQDILQAACGKIGQNIGSVCVSLYCFGTCITFLIIIGDQFDRALASLYGPNFCHYWYMDRAFLTGVCAAVFILPLCFSRRIDFLKYASSIGVLAIAYIVALIIYEYFEGVYIPYPVKHQPDAWTDVFLVVPVICFGYQCHVSAVPIYSCMKDRTISRFTLCVCAAMFVCLLAYSGAGVFGYLTFGNNVPSDILQGYDARKPHVLIAIISLACKTCTTYPILAFCGREALFNLFYNCTCIPYRGGKWGRHVISLCWFIGSLILAILIPDIGQVIQILGSLAAVFIFVFPGVSLLQLTLRQDPSLVRKKNVLYCMNACLFIVIGTFLFGTVLTQAIKISAIAWNNEQQGISLCNVTRLTNIRLFNV